MRAPVQKKRPRRPGKQTASTAAPQQGGAGEQPAVGTGRPARVRNRLIGAVAVVAAAIAGAGAPSILAASSELNDTQNLVTLAAQTQAALTLAHALADERDEVTAYIAAGRPAAKAPSEERGARVDRQADELRADAPAALADDLAGIASVRRAALTGKGSALEAHQDYSRAIAELHALAEELAEQLPPRAGAGSHAFADLDTAVQQAASARGLLVAALSVPKTTQTVTDPLTGLTTTRTVTSAADRKQRDALTVAAQEARLRSAAALADFRDTAPAGARAAYDRTVTGPEVGTADGYLAKLTDQPALSSAELNTGPAKVGDALSARVELMRGAEASLNDRRTKELELLRDDDVTALEIRVAVLGGLILLALGITTAMARTLTRPLAVLRIGSARVAADPATEEPIKFTGRNDEFAQVVRSVNALHAHALTLHERLAPLEGDRKHLVGQRRTMADERDRLRAELAGATAHLERVRQGIHGTFVTLALRTLALVERQLAVIEGMEEREQDSERLSTLFQLDHFATVMRRHSENLLVLAGAEHGQQHAGPVPLVDVVRAAVSEIERYDRVRIAALPPHVQLTGSAADDLSHLVAELLENATAFSPPEVPVEISGWLLESGEVMLSVQDDGRGIPVERLERLNARLKDFDPEQPYDHEGGEGLGLGLYVVARLAHRHGVRVRLREQKQGGTAGVVVVPVPLLVTPPAATAPTATTAGQGAAASLTGAGTGAGSAAPEARATVVVRESESGGDPLIEAAERALRERAAAAASAGDPSGATATGTGTTARTLPEEPAQPGAAGTPAEPEPVPAPETGLRPEAPGASGGAAAPDGGGEAPEVTSETTMELLAPVLPADEGTATADGPTGDPFVIGPDTHERAADEGEAAHPTQDPHTDATAPAKAPRYTGKGLPKRTPRITASVPVPRSGGGGVNAEELRRRLGGFHRGASQGHRDVEVEIAEKTGENRAPAARRHQDNAVEASGGTSEEAST